MDEDRRDPDAFLRYLFLETNMMAGTMRIVLYLLVFVVVAGSIFYVAR